MPGGVQQHTSTDNSILENVHGVGRGSLPRGHQRSGPVVVHLPVPEDVAERVQVRDRVAVKRYANEVTAALHRLRRTVRVCHGVGLAGAGHVVDERIPHVDGELSRDGPCAGDSHALPHERSRAPALLGPKVIDGAHLVVRPPPAPVAERIRVSQDFGLVRSAAVSHGVPLP